MTERTTGMDREKLTAEMSGYSISELEMICETQGEYYTDEEMDLITVILEQKRQEEKTAESKGLLRETIYCVIALLFNVVGLILGIYLLLSHDPNKKKMGKHVMIAAFISVLLGVFLLMGGFRF